MRLKRYIWPIIYSIILSAFTAYVLLDTFVIPRTYSIVQSEESIDSSGSETARSNNAILAINGDYYGGVGKWLCSSERGDLPGYGSQKSRSPCY